MTDTYIGSFRPWTPPYKTSQSILLEQIKKSFDQLSSEEGRLFDRVVCKPNMIQERGHVTPFFASNDTQRLSQLTTSERTALYAHNTLPWVQAQIESFVQPEEPIFHVSCTGYMAPSPTQIALSNCGFNHNPTLNIYHMGCYAFFPAIRAAQNQLHQNIHEKKAHILHSELCTLHFSTRKNTPEQWVVQSLFSDGCIHFEVSKERQSGRSFRIRSIKEQRVPNSENLMKWIVGEHGFQMTLDRKVPRAIESELISFLNTLLPQDAAKSEMIFAIHPGGPSILRSCENALQLDAHQISHSKNILKQYGNMSSATIPYILNSIASDPTVHPGQEVIAIAFGPGLTLIGAHIELVNGEEK